MSPSPLSPYRAPLARHGRADDPRRKHSYSQMELVFPLVDTLAALGGVARAKDVTDALADRLRLPADLRTATVHHAGCGQTHSLWARHARFAQQKAKQRHLLASAGHGLWTLTDAGHEAVAGARPGIVVNVWVDADGTPLHAQVEAVVALPAADAPDAPPTLIETVHTARRGDARELSWIDSNSIALGLTSTPYWDLKAYDGSPEQLHIAGGTYEGFLDQLDRVWAEYYRVLMPGGRLCVNVGDVLRSRKQHGRHHVLPLHADILVRGRQRGFDVLTGIRWSKYGNLTTEQGGAAMLGKPYEPNPVIKSEAEHILLFRKPGPYRSPTAEQRRLSRLTKDEHRRWVRDVWDDVPGARTTEGHPAPFPVEIPYRLIRCFSFVGDHVLDTFGGRFTTAIAAMRAGRNSLVTEIAPSYTTLGITDMVREATALEAIARRAA